MSTPHEYHLLEEKQIMQAADEALSHECNSWWRLDSHPSGKWMIGSPYTRGLFVPIRRPGPRPERSLLIPPTP